LRFRALGAAFVVRGCLIIPEPSLTAWSTCWDDLVERRPGPPHPRRGPRFALVDVSGRFVSRRLW
jgi:hypothetical protein